MVTYCSTRASMHWLTMSCLIWSAFSNKAHSAEPVRALSDPLLLSSSHQALRGNDVSATLTVRYADNKIYNPLTGTDDRVHLRSYNGDLAGPTITVEPGDTLRISLKNELPQESCVHPEGTHNIPNCFNSTNLHTHGLHVSPTGNSDNVFLDLAPGTQFEYEFHIPSDHPAGTFWYHSHRHGSTALQVSSGMAGALIVRGTRAADVDSALRRTNGAPFEDRVLLFQQIQYSCTGADGKLSWDCSNQVGQIEGYGDQFGPRTWVASKRFTSINGAVQPTIQAKQNEIQRWRLIHAGVRETIKLRLAPSDLSVASSARAFALPLTGDAEKTRKALAAWTENHCKTDQVVNQSEIAVDGLTRNSVSKKAVNILQPGYRSDVLVYFDKPGIYCVIDDAAPADTIINGESREGKGRNLLALVKVEANDSAEDPAQFLRTLDLSRFSARAPIRADEVNGHQSVALNLDVTSSATRFGVDNLSYSPTRFDRMLQVDSVDEWSITSTFVGHPFHIHVNPFQIIRILKPDGAPVVDASGNCTDVSASGVLDTQYCDLINVFRDTIFVKQGYVVFARMRYDRYIGDFVLHCHILDHEDQGMMQNVRITPGPTAAAHAH